MSNFWIVAGQVGVLFVLIGVGAACRFVKLLDEQAIKGIIRVLLMIVTPCLIIDTFQRPFDPSTGGSLLIALLICLAIHLVSIALACLFVHHRSENTQKVLRLSAVFCNAGFMGIPLEQAVLGDEGVLYGIVYVVVFNLVMWSWGYWMMGGGGRPKVMTFIINPGTVGMAIGLPFFLLSVKMPEMVHAPVKFLAGMNTPLAMIVIGYELAEAKLGPVLRMPAAWLAASFRLLIVPVLLTVALYPFREVLSRPMMLALVTATAAPVAAMVSMFAASFHRDVYASIGMVCGTTLLSAVTMPVVIAMAMRFL